MAWKTRRPGDAATNARKRYTRQANRYLRDSEKATDPTEQARLQTLARSAAEKALATFEKQVPFSKMRKDLQEVALRTGAEFAPKQSKSVRERIIREDATESTLLYKTVDGKRVKRSKGELKEIEAKSIMSTSVGSRIFASLEDVWRPARRKKSDEDGYTIDRAEAERLIFDKLGVSSWADVIEKFQDAFGDELFAEPENRIRYDEIVTSAAEKLGI